MMLESKSSHLRAVLQALFVTFLWSTSWILIKIGLEDIPALTFAGLRYSLAFLCLLPFALRGGNRAILQKLSRREWIQLAVLGIVLYALTQGGQFVALGYLPAVTVSLLLNFGPVLVALLAIPLLGERPTARQWLGTLLFIAGALVYFFPLHIPAREMFGLLVAFLSVAANALASVLGRQVNRGRALSPLVVTTISMGIGSLLLLGTGMAVQGLPSLSVGSWALILWLAVVNTAFAFTLWNLTFRTLSAMESSVINNTMLLQIAILAWLFLGESLTWLKIVGMAIAGLGALIVQLRLPGAKAENAQLLSEKTQRTTS